MSFCNSNYFLLCFEDKICFCLYQFFVIAYFLLCIDICIICLMQTWGYFCREIHHDVFVILHNLFLDQSYHQFA